MARSIAGEIQQHSETDHLILGAGPAGLQLGYFFANAGRDYLILEAGQGPGTFFTKFPRHRTLISINKAYTGYDDPEINLRWDWNSLLSNQESLLLKNYSRRYFPAAEELLQYLYDFSSRFDLRIRYDARVVRISRNGRFQLVDEQGRTYSARCLIVATGVSKLYLPPIPGIELATSYTEVSVKPEDFANQSVLIIGKGNSGFETADNLISTAARIHIVSPHPVNFAWRTHFVGHLRAINNNFLDTYQLKSQNAVLDATVERIERRTDGKFAVTFSYSHAGGEQEQLVYDSVIACTGFRFDASLFDDDCSPRLVIDDRLPEQTSAWESTNVPDLYFAGTLMQARDYKKTTSAFIHGFRYNVRALHRILEQKYHGAAWPARRITATASDLAAAVLERLNSSSALWQQFGFLADLIVVSDRNGEAAYLEEFPVDYVHDSEWGCNDHYYLVTLEYGPEHTFKDPFNIERIPRNAVERAAMSNFLHPVVRRFKGPQLLAEHHVIEDLAAEWREPEHVEPLLAFFRSQVEGIASRRPGRRSRGGKREGRLYSAGRSLPRPKRVSPPI